MDFRAQHDGRRVLPIFARCDAVRLAERARKGLLRGKTVIARDIEQVPFAVAHLFEREGELSAAQIIAQAHAGNFAEFARGVEFGIAQHRRKAAQRQRFVIMRGDCAIDFVHDRLNELLPFVHARALRFLPLLGYYRRA